MFRGMNGSKRVGARTHVHTYTRARVISKRNRGNRTVGRGEERRQGNGTEGDKKGDGRWKIEPRQRKKGRGKERM